MWSRFELACMIWHCINNNGTIYYYHTDSLKCGGCNNDIFINWYDPEMNSNKWSKLNKFKFGAVDYEETFEYFYTPETLKNIGIMRDEEDNTKIRIDITISGIKADVYFADIYKKYQKQDYTIENVKNLIEELTKKMQPRIIPGDKTGKLVRVKKFCGVKSELNQVNFGTLENVPYNFLNFKEDN